MDGSDRLSEPKQNETLGIAPREQEGCCHLRADFTGYPEPGNVERRQEEERQCRAHDDTPIIA
jgi:hypothetical protein